MRLFHRGKKDRKMACSQTTFYKASFGKIEYMFAVTPIPPVNDRRFEDGGIWNGGYMMVSLLNLSRRTYFLAAGGPPMGWEYIAEKYQLDDEEAAGFAAVLGKILDRDIRLADKELTERCFMVIPGGKTALRCKGGAR